MRKRRDTTAPRAHRNLKMNDEVYKLRRKVIDHIYEAKAMVPSLPRIEVRITECEHREILGCARMKDCVIWIPKTSIARDDLRATVLHEVLHAAYGIPHISGCPLMGASSSKTTKVQEDGLFVKYASAAKNANRTAV